MHTIHWTSVDGTFQTETFQERKQAKAALKALTSAIARLRSTPDAEEPRLMSWLERHPEQRPFEMARTCLDRAVELVGRQNAAIDRGDVVNALRAEWEIGKAVDQAANLLSNVQVTR